MKYNFLKTKAFIIIKNFSNEMNESEFLFFSTLTEKYFINQIEIDEFVESNFRYKAVQCGLF
jgi:hypothetical protein